MMDFRHIINFVNSPGDSVEEEPVSSPYSDDAYIKETQEPLSSPYSDDASVKAEESYDSEDGVCRGCGQVIHDRWLLHVGHAPYHMACLRCCMCLRTLDSHTTCYIRGSEVFCKFHYGMQFGTKCAVCDTTLYQEDWVRYAHDNVYHLDCFRCSQCGRELNTGDEFVLRGNSLLCKRHLQTNTHSHAHSDDSESVSSGESDSSEAHRKTRARSSFTPDQAALLQRHFERQACPSSEDMEAIADCVGHTRKVVQVWFQNARARSKKAARNNAPRPRVHRPGHNTGLLM